MEVYTQEEIAEQERKKLLEGPVPEAKIEEYREMFRNQATGGGQRGRGNQVVILYGRECHSEADVLFAVAAEKAYPTQTRQQFAQAQAEASEWLPLLTIMNAPLTPEDRTQRVKEAVTRWVQQRQGLVQQLEDAKTAAAATASKVAQEQAGLHDLVQDLENQVATLREDNQALLAGNGVLRARLELIVPAPTRARTPAGEAQAVA